MNEKLCHNIKAMKAIILKNNHSEFSKNCNTKLDNFKNTYLKNNANSIHMHFSRISFALQETPICNDTLVWLLF